MGSRRAGREVGCDGVAGQLELLLGLTYPTTVGSPCGRKIRESFSAAQRGHQDLLDGDPRCCLREATSRSARRSSRHAMNAARHGCGAADPCGVVLGAVVCADRAASVCGERSRAKSFLCHHDNTRCRFCDEGPSVALGSGTADTVMTVVMTGRWAIPSGGTVDASLATATRTTAAATSATASQARVRSTAARGGGGRLPGVLTRRPWAAASCGELRPVSRRGRAAAGALREPRTPVVMVTGDHGWSAVTSMG